MSRRVRLFGGGHGEFGPRPFDEAIAAPKSVDIVMPHRAGVGFHQFEHAPRHVRHAVAEEASA
jgi:hypothetical protein